MGKSKSPSVEIPTYKAPTPTTFNTPWGSASLTDNVLTFAQSPDDAATSQAVKKIRSDLLSSLGIADPTLQSQKKDVTSKMLTSNPQIDDLLKNVLTSLGGSQDTSKYTDLLLKEALRTIQPSMENALIGRGLGGSTVYKDALTDLYSKLGTQSALAGYDLQNQQQTGLLNQLSTLQNLQSSQTNIPLAQLSALLGLESSDMSQLTALQNILGQDVSSGQNLLQLMSGYNTNQNQLAQQQYATTLPYLAKVNTPSLNGWQAVGSMISPAYADYNRSMGYQNVPGLSIQQGAQLALMAAGGSSRRFKKNIKLWVKR